MGRHEGQRVTTKKRLAFFHQEYDGLELGAGWGLDKKTLEAAIGSVITITAPDENSTTFHRSGDDGPRFLAHWDDRDQVGEWELLDRSSRVQHQRRKQNERAAKASTTPLDDLAPVRARLSKMLPDQRAAALWSVFEYLSKG